MTLVVVLEYVGNLLQWVSCLIAGLGSSLLDCFGLASLSCGFYYQWVMRVVNSRANNCLFGVLPPLSAKPGMDQVIIDVGVPFIGQKGICWEN